MITEDAAIRQYVTFCLGRELFGVEVARTREILGLVPITSVPQTPEYMLGVINLRGQVVPVIDMRIMLGLPAESQTQDTCILVFEVQVGGEEQIVGALADSVREVLELRDDMVEPPPRLGMRLSTDYVAGMGKVEEQFLIMLDLDRIFSDGDLALLSSVSEKESVTA